MVGGVIIEMDEGGFNFNMQRPNDNTEAFTKKLPTSPPLPVPGWIAKTDLKVHL